MAFTDVNIVVLGSPEVGKTAFIKQFLDGTFSADYEPTDIGYHTHHVETTDNKVQPVHIVEVSEREGMSTERDRRIRGGDAFLVMYAVNDEKSLKKAEKICKRIYDIKEPEIPLILVGHKTDLKEDSDMKLEKRQSKVEKKLNCLHMEASARLETNVGPVFDAIIDLARTSMLRDYMLPRRDSLQLSSYGVFMHPCRISKLAITELHEEDAIRQQKQEQSTARTSESSNDFERHRCPRPPRNSDGNIDKSETRRKSSAHHIQNDKSRESRQPSRNDKRNWENRELGNCEAIDERKSRRKSSVQHYGEDNQEMSRPSVILAYPKSNNSRYGFDPESIDLDRKVSWTLIRQMLAPQQSDLTGHDDLAGQLTVPVSSDGIYGCSRSKHPDAKPVADKDGPVIARGCHQPNGGINEESDRSMRRRKLGFSSP